MSSSSFACCSKLLLVSPKSWISTSRSFSTFRCSVTSRNTSTTPMVVPSEPFIGALLSAIARSVPSFAMSTEWLPSPTTLSPLKTFAIGSSTGLRVASFSIFKISCEGCPVASSIFQPVNSCAISFINVIRPSVSVAITPSPMLFNVTTKRSWTSCKLSSTRLSSLMSRWVAIVATTFPSLSSTLDADTITGNSSPLFRLPTSSPDQPPASTVTGSTSSSNFGIWSSA